MATGKCSKDGDYFSKKSEYSKMYERMDYSALESEKFEMIEKLHCLESNIYAATGSEVIAFAAIICTFFSCIIPIIGLQVNIFSCLLAICLLCSFEIIRIEILHNSYPKKHKEYALKLLCIEEALERKNKLNSM